MSDCAVCIGGGCEETLEMLFVGNVKARKPYICCECLRPIEIGEQHQKHVGSYDREISTYRTCLVCAEIRDSFACGGTWTYTTLWEELRDYGFPELNDSCFEKLKTVAAKKYLRERWMKWKGLAA